jgi:hypothetical protein
MPKIEQISIGINNYIIFVKTLRKSYWPSMTLLDLSKSIKIVEKNSLLDSESIKYFSFSPTSKIFLSVKSSDCSWLIQLPSNKIERIGNLN